MKHNILSESGTLQTKVWHMHSMSKDFGKKNDEYSMKW